jgi:hypothetical protein
MAGRPKLLDDDLIESWCEAIATGLTPRLTCYRIGIDYSTAKKWLSKGDADHEACEDTIEARFFARHTRARADRSGRWLEALTAGSTQDLRWLLEHCEPEEFGAKSRVELTGKDDGPIQTATHIVILPAKMTVDEWQAAALTAVKNGDG